MLSVRQIFVLVTLLLPLAALQAADEVDLAVVHKIKNEAFQHSQVMNHVQTLSDQFGPRVSGSPAYRASARWSVDQLSAWQLTDARLESWGEFGRGWSLEHYSAHMVSPSYAVIPGIPLGWTGSTDGVTTADLVLAPLFPTQEAQNLVRWDLSLAKQAVRAYAKKYRGQLRGKIVLLDRQRELALPETVESERLDSTKLSERAKSATPVASEPYDWPIQQVPSDPKKRQRLFAWLPLAVMTDYWQNLQTVRDELNAFLVSEGVVAAIKTDQRGSGGLSFAESRGSWRIDAPKPPPIVAVQPEAYSRLFRLLDRNIAVQMQLDIRSKFHEQDTNGYNVIAEIPGRSRSRSSEVVMIGAHLDSWHGATGATDNAAGSAVMLEVMRILKTLDLAMDRTVRIALWGGEEQGLYGSQGYVRQHFADPVTMQLKPGHAKLAGYFNLDNGGGKIRGIYLQGNDMVRPVFRSLLAPFADLGANTISIRNTSGTDHLAFDAVGLPGFQFIQDPLDYSSRTHHSNVDDVAHIQPADLMQAAAVIASVVYHTANRKELLPRKPSPKPLPAKRSAG